MDPPRTPQTIRPRTTDPLVAPLLLDLQCPSSPPDAAIDPRPSQDAAGQRTHVRTDFVRRTRSRRTVAEVSLLCFETNPRILWTNRGNFLQRSSSSNLARCVHSSPVNPRDGGTKATSLGPPLPKKFVRVPRSLGRQTGAGVRNHSGLVERFPPSHPPFFCVRLGCPPDSSEPALLLKTRLGSSRQRCHPAPALHRRPNSVPQNGSLL